MTQSCTRCGDQFEPQLAQIKKQWWVCAVCRKVAYREYRERAKVKGTYSTGKYAPDYWSRPEVIERIAQTRKSPEGIAKLREKWRKADQLRWRNPEERQKKLARRRLQQAIQKGKILKRPCIECGKFETEAHHPDYSKPFDVIWLCRSCHRRIHRSSN